MQPVEITDAHRAYWSDFRIKEATFAAPDDPADCEPCQAIITAERTNPEGRVVVRVPWRLNEIELAQLANGGTIWLSTWDGLPAHMLEVQGP